MDKTKLDDEYVSKLLDITEIMNNASDNETRRTQLHKLERTIINYLSKLNSSDHFAEWYSNKELIRSAKKFLKDGPDIQSVFNIHLIKKNNNKTYRVSIKVIGNAKEYYKSIIKKDMDLFLRKIILGYFNIIEDYNVVQKKIIEFGDSTLGQQVNYNL